MSCFIWFHVYYLVVSLYSLNLKYSLCAYSDLQKLPWSTTMVYPERGILHSDPDINIDARLWLTLRLEVARLLGSLVKVPVDDQSKMADSMIGTFEYHVDQGLKEADAFNDRETMCKLKMMLAQNSIRCGEDVNQIVMDLKVLNNFFIILPSESHTILFVI